MDEAARRREREAARDGDVSGRVRVAHDLRRAGRWQQALAATEGLDGDATAQAVRAESHLRLESLDLALAAGARAESLARGSLPAGVAQEAAEAALLRAAAPAAPDGVKLTPATIAVSRLAALLAGALLGDGAAPALASVLADDDPLARAAVARVPALAARLHDDASPLVRFVARRAQDGEAALRARATRDERADPAAKRLFSAHGPDYEFGDVVLLGASTEATLSSLDPGFYRALDLHLGPGLVVAFSNGYGLAAPPRRATDEFRARLLALDRSGVLPFPLRLEEGMPYDPLGPATAADEGLLVARYAQDLRHHPARRDRPGPDSAVHRRLLALFVPGTAGTQEEVDALLVEAEGVLSPTGLRALRLFARQARHDSRKGRIASAEKSVTPMRLPMDEDDLTEDSDARS